MSAATLNPAPADVLQVIQGSYKYRAMQMESPWFCIVMNMSLPAIITIIVLFGVLVTNGSPVILYFVAVDFIAVGVGLWGTFRALRRSYIWNMKHLILSPLEKKVEEAKDLLMPDYYKTLDEIAGYVLTAESDIRVWNWLDGQRTSVLEMLNELDEDPAIPTLTAWDISEEQRIARVKAFYESYQPFLTKAAKLATEMEELRQHYRERFAIPGA